MITADTITDEQIREMCRYDHEHDAIANVALSQPKTDTWLSHEDRFIARARCAEILNARIECCPKCGIGPLHATESDDLGRCARCAVDG